MPASRHPKIRCPFPDHDDTDASFVVYETAAEGVFCFGCRRGGGIVDFASLLTGGPWGRDLRGAEYRRIRDSIVSFYEQRAGVGA